MVLKGTSAIRTPGKRMWESHAQQNLIGQCVPGVEKIESIEVKKADVYLINN